jgi:hypothetical protein
MRESRRPLYWDTYWGEDKEHHYKSAELHALRERLVTRTFAVSALAAAILQLAKQGISIVHGEPNNCPPGRTLSSQTLRNVIWQARNQVLHREEGRFSQAVQTCFDTLANHYGAPFGDFRTRNMAPDILSFSSGERGRIFSETSTRSRDADRYVYFGSDFANRRAGPQSSA